ncbi:MAG: DUF3137 domain-containing protein [Lachnospiraceae bacterium]|nr:DUF3137 domain-containing protein [Lachnospiraceae bacterium]
MENSMGNSIVDKLQGEYEQQTGRYLNGNRISRCMLLVGLVCMVIGLVNREQTALMALFFVLAVGSWVAGVLIGQNRKRAFSTYVGQTVTKQVMEEYFQVDELIMNGETPLDEIRSAELFWNYNRIIGSRVIRGRLHGVPFQCSNVTLDETTGTANKNTRVFSGQYLFIECREPVDGTIRILDKENPVRTLVQGCRPVKLSSVLEFDDLFEVSATDAAAARNYLTEDRRKALVECKKLIRNKGGEETAQLNLMIKGSRIYAALGSGVFLFHHQTELRKLEELVEYYSLDADYVCRAAELLRV